MSRKCEAMVIPRGDPWGAFHKIQYSKPEWKDGYCKIHHPDTVRARRDAEQKRYEEKWAATKAEQEKQEDMPRRIAALEAENKALREAVELAFRDYCVNEMGEIFVSTAEVLEKALNRKDGEG